MKQIYWIGGAPCAGKSTIANMLAERHGWQVYHLDEHVGDYLERADADKHPHIAQFKKIGLKQFLTLPTAEQFQKILGLSMDYMQLTIADIAALPDDKSILVEGSNYRPLDVLRFLGNADHAVWLVPSEAFLLHTYPQRGTWVQQLLRNNYPEDKRLDVFEKWMKRDTLHARWAAEQAQELGIKLIVVDGRRSISENATRVEQHFGIAELLEN